MSGDGIPAPIGARFTIAQGLIFVAGGLTGRRGLVGELRRLRTTRR